MSDVVNSKPFKIFGGIVVAAVGIATGQPWLTAYGASMWVSGVADSLRELHGTPTAAEKERGRMVNVLSNEADMGVIYGRTKVGVQIVDVRLHASDAKILYVVAAISLGSEDGSGIEEVEAIYFDERLAIQSPVFESEPSTSGVQSAFSGVLSYGLHRGADAQTVDAELDSVFSAYDADTVGRGVAYIALKLTYDENVYPTGIPNVTAIVKGNRVWDPRGTPAWAHSDSPALCILDYLTSKRYGAGVAYAERDGGALSEIDEQSFIDAANYHDDVITMGPGSDTRFTCNGRLDTGRPIARNLEDLLTACRSELIYESGKFRLVTPQATTAETFELTPDNIIGEVEYWRGGTDDVPNRVICHYVDEANEWLPNEAAWPEANQANDFLAADNDFENVLEIALPFTVGSYRAQQIGMVLLREAREDAGIALRTTEEGLKLRVGEVVKVTMPRAGFAQAEFRVRAIGLLADNTIQLVLAEYDAAAYSLDALNTRDTLPASSLPDITTCEPPSSLTFESGNSTVLVTQGGAIIPRILLGWVASPDAYLRHYEVQIQETTGGTWRSAAPDPLKADTSVYIADVVEGVAYDVRLRAVNTVGVQSVWVTLTNQTVELHTVLPPVQNTSDVVTALNGDFEAGLAYWAISGGSPSDMSEEASLVHGGAKALRITKPGASERDVYQVSDARDVAKDSTSPLLLRVQAGDQVRLRGYYRTDGTISARVGIRQRDLSKAHVSWQVSPLSATASYTAFEAVYTIPSGVAYITILLSTTTAATTGFVLFDTLAIERLVDGDSAQEPFDLTAHNFYADTGYIGGWQLAASEIVSAAGNVKLQANAERILVGSASAPLTGAGVFVGKDGSDYEFRAGDPAGEYIHWDGSGLSIVGTITATAGTIGGWSIGATSLSSGSISIISGTDEQIRIGSATAPLTGAGVFIGKSGGAYQFRAGDPAGKYLLWDGSALSLVGDLIFPSNFAGGAAIGWEALVRRGLQGARNLAFNEGFEDGTDFWVLNGDDGSANVITNSANAHSGNKYLELVSSTASASNPHARVADDTGAVQRFYPVIPGDNVLLSAWAYRSGGDKSFRLTLGFYDKDKANPSWSFADNDPSAAWAQYSMTEVVPSGKYYVSALVEVFKSSGTAVTTIRVDDVRLKILMESGDILANTITATQIGSLVFTGKTATFDTGSIGGWTLASSELSSGSVKIQATAERMLFGAATAPLTGKGIFIGKDGSDYEFRAGDPSGDYIHFDGTTFTIKTNTFTGSNPVFTGSVTVQGGDGAARVYLTAGSGHGSVDIRAGATTYGSLTAAVVIPVTNRHAMIIRGQATDEFVDIQPASGAGLLYRSKGFGPLHIDDSDRTHTGNTNETTLETITIPERMLSSQNGFRLEAWGDRDNGSNLSTIAWRFKFGGTTLVTHTAAAAFARWHVTLSITFQRWGVVITVNGVASTVTWGDTTIDTTSSQDFTITAQLGNGADTAGLRLTHAHYFATV